MVSASAIDPVPVQTTADKRGGWARVQRVMWTALVGLSAFTATNVFLTITSVKWMTEMIAAPVFPSIIASNIFLLVHVVLAVPCILTGPFLFMDRFRDSPRAWIHRWLGYTYVVPVLISAVVGLVLAVYNTHGPLAKAGFSTLAVVWFSTTAIALRFALKRDWVRHRRWMLRSYAISLAVVTVRFIPPPFGMTKMEWYPYMTWACWIPNAILGEMYVRMTTHKGALKWRARAVPTTAETR